MHLRNYVVHIITFVASLSLLAGCQSSTPSSTKKTQKNTPYSTTQITKHTVPVIKSKDGVQDIRWTLSQVKSRKALFFSQMPMITLQSNTQRFIGNTGCNTLYGSYDIDVVKQTIQFKASAGYQRCDNALAQEADLMDALARVEYFQVTNQTIRFMDRSRQVLIQAEQR